jgi:AAA+ superfamily predicted ATPase
MANEELVAAMSKVVELDPSNVGMRLNLATLLVESDLAAEALKHARHILADAPDHLGALRIAADACDKLGDSERGRSYRRMAEALGSRLIDLPEPADEQEEPFQPPRKMGADGDTQPPGPDDSLWVVEDSNVKLSDVAGLEQVKARLHMTFLGPMMSPDMREAFGHKMRGGLMLYGPPGCGKTYLAKAIAGELGAGFLSVGISEVLDMWLGNSEKNLHAAFEAARRRKPCVLFFDEIDALGRKRTLTRDHGGRGVINQLLSELDGVKSNNDGVFILAATNHPWDVDSALRRPGRFDRLLLVSPPDRPAREAIARLALMSRPHENLDWTWISEKTEDFSGADVRYLCETAVEFALAESMRVGRVCPVDQNMIKRALKEVKASMRPWLESAKNYALFSNDGGEYDDLLQYLKARRMV